MTSEYEKMISGRLYRADKIEPEKSAQRGRELVHRINHLPDYDREKVIALERQLFASTGKEFEVTAPLYVDYGFNTHIGENFYANMDCIFLDVAPIYIGDNVLFGPRVQLITATHPIDAGVRTRQLEFGKPIHIGNQVWLGAGVIVNPGVTIGDNSIVGSGAVVTHDLPANVIAVGNPAHILREITDLDREEWEQKERDYYQ